MSFRTSSVWKSFGVVTAALLFVVFVREHQAGQVVQSRSSALGGCSVKQMMDRSAPICRALLPSEASLRLVPEPNQDPLRASLGVHCIDAAGKERAALEWDAGTGDLVRVGRTAEIHLVEGRRLTAPEAMKAAQHWMIRLRLWRWEDQRHVVGTPVRVNAAAFRAWFIRLHREGCTVDLHIDAFSGDLLSAIILRNRFGARLSR